MPLNNDNASITQLKFPTDYELDSIVLGVAGATTNIDLKQQLVELNYFEDIFNNSISGRLVISDPIGYLNLTGLNGTEFIKIVFKKSRDYTDTINRTFRVYSITNRHINRSLNHESYTIEFCSEELLLSEQYRISKSYKKQSITNIIKDVLNNFLKVGVESGKNVYMDETWGQYDFVLPNKKIFQTINWLSAYAQPNPASGQGADFLFFENSQGFFFKSLQNLYKQESAFTYSYNPKNTTNNTIDNINNVLNFQVVDYIDTLGALSKGTFGNRLITIDPLTRTKKITDFNYNNTFDSNKTLNGYPVINNYKNRYNKGLYDAPPKNMEASTLRMIVSNSNEPSTTYCKNVPGSVANDFFVEKFLPNRAAQIALANYMKLKITVPGNSEIVVGSILDINVDTMKPLSENPNPKGPGNRELDPYYSGRYLVTAVRHIITPGSYISILEVCKDSHISPVTSVDNSSSNWKNIVKGNQA